MSKPISPQEIADFQEKHFPPEVFNAFNELISANYYQGSATVEQAQVSTLIADKLKISKNEVFAKGYLNIEESYRAAGWKVDYDKPAYNESYGAYFKFRKK